MVKAFKTSLPGFEDTTDDGDSGNDKPEDIDCFDENEDEFEHLPKHSRCYAHTLQLVIKDGLKDCTSHMCTVIAKASKIVNFVRRSIHASEMLETENKLQAANATRWNSQLTMIRSILKISEEKLNKVESPVKLSSYERKILHELSLILDPFEYVTLLVQNNVSASLTIPVTLGLKHKVNQLSNVYNNKMVTTLKSSIETRLTQFEKDNDFILAAILDPRFKLRWSEPEKVAPYTVLLKNMTSALDSHLDTSTPTLNFTDYVTSYWVESNQRLWNHYATEGPRTTNHFEGLHSKVKKLVKAAHPNIFNMISLLRQEEAVHALTLLQYRAGGKRIPRKRKYREIDNRLQTLK
ncbi:Hypothetical predicted protein [Mytilus galloprovincialis]|uniref:Uncharacterized protein n=1 Tax=Mytilus galloprovincialis TaxID=29158 RepID=A0A8B6H4B0_MYTGA|nr:Hypothetical predicted protein [Mytilus galloprovincialis]